MARVFVGDLPDDSFLRRYRVGRTYTDCYCIDLSGVVSLPDYVAAFYTSWLFRIERWILARAVGKASTDEGVRQLAHGQATQLAAWRVEDRASDQLLLCDYLGRTRSWLMVERRTSAGASCTRLYFGSALLPSSTSAKAGAGRGAFLRGMVVLHRLYSRALLRAACGKLSA